MGNPSKQNDTMAQWNYTVSQKKNRTTTINRTYFQQITTFTLYFWQRETLCNSEFTAL